MTLDIIIPEYKEPIELRKRLLDSIQSQQGIIFNDINVIIVNDNSSMYTPKSYFDKYWFKVKYLINDENKGQGYSRQKGIDNSNGDYILFIDSDDFLASIYSLYILLSCANDTHADIIRSAINRGTSEGRYIKAEINNINMFLHGKLFKRQFLIDNNIRFDDKLRFCEDSHFLRCALALTKNIIDLDYITYNWAFNKNSFTRDHMISKYIDYFDDVLSSPILTYEFLKDKIDNDSSYAYLIKGLFGIYLMYTSDNLKDIYDGERKDKIKELINKYHFLISINKEKNLKYFNEEFIHIIMRNNFDSNKTYDDFVKEFNIK
jgi:glycosyltransferase involved in cell wall biosynthesis